MYIDKSFVDNIRKSTLFMNPYQWDINLKCKLDMAYPLVFKDLKKSGSLYENKDIEVYPYQHYSTWISSISEARYEASKSVVHSYRMNLYDVLFINLYSNQTSMCYILERINKRLDEYDELIRFCRHSFATVLDFRNTLANALENYIKEMKLNGNR